ncbi:hypothetical protein [Streptomyces sp. NPDC001153]
MAWDEWERLKSEARSSYSHLTIPHKDLVPVTRAMAEDGHAFAQVHDAETRQGAGQGLPGGAGPRGRLRVEGAGCRGLPVWLTWTGST